MSHPVCLSGPPPLSALIIKRGSDQVIRRVAVWVESSESPANLSSALTTPGGHDEEKRAEDKVERYLE